MRVTAQLNRAALRKWHVVHVEPPVRVVKTPEHHLLPLRLSVPALDP
jgi:hypothetical protein